MARPRKILLTNASRAVGLAISDYYTVKCETTKGSNNECREGAKNLEPPDGLSDAIRKSWDSSILKSDLFSREENRVLTSRTYNKASLSYEY